MNNIKNIISSFNQDEQQQFITYLGKKNKRKDSKNIQLFNLLKQEKLSSEETCIAIYGSYKKQAYHALRKRLYHSLIDFTAKINLEEENSIDILAIKYLIASRAFLTRKQYKTGFNILNKAEQISREHELFSILNEIYQTKIQYAHTQNSKNLKTLISEFEFIKKLQHNEEQLNIASAKIKQAVNNSFYNNQTNDFKTLVEDVFNQHDIDLENSLSFKSLFQLVNLISISAFITKDYYNTEPFLLDAYKQVNLNYNHITKYPYYHIQILYLIANTLFRNKKFEASLSFLDIMHQKMLGQRKKYYSTFYLKYSLLRALNLNYTNNQTQAITLLEPFSGKKHKDLESLLDIHLALTMIYIQANKLDKAKEIFSKFYHTNAWYESKVGKEWVIKKNLIELILHIDLKNINLVESRLLSFKRQHFPYLKEIHQERAITFVKFVEIYYKNPETITTTDFFNKVEISFEWLDVKHEDIFVMSFYAWLKSKMERKKLYVTTLKLIEAAQTVNS